MITSEGLTNQTPQWTTSGRTGCHCWRFDTKPSGSVDFTLFGGGCRFRDFSDEQLDEFRLKVQEIFGKKILAINIPAAGTAVFILFDDEQNEIADSLSKKTTLHFGKIVEGERIEVMGQWIHFKPARKQSSLAPEPAAPAPAAAAEEGPAPAEGSFDGLAPGDDGSWEIVEPASAPPSAPASAPASAPEVASTYAGVVVTGPAAAAAAAVTQPTTADEDVEQQICELHALMDATMGEFGTIVDESVHLQSIIAEKDKEIAKKDREIAYLHAMVATRDLTIRELSVAHRELQLSVGLC